MPDGWLHVFDGVDGTTSRSRWSTRTSAPLRRMAVFDVVVNNADRKGGHVLAMTGGHRYGVDHGVSFHIEDKLRTVLWGWAGEPLPAEELGAVEAVRDRSGGELGDRLDRAAHRRELAALTRRCERLLRARHASRAARRLAGRSRGRRSEAGPRRWR